MDDDAIQKEVKAVYNPDDRNGVLTINVWKEEGEGVWKDLDLLGRLVNPVRMDCGVGGVGDGEDGVGDGNKVDTNKITVLSSTDTNTEAIPNDTCTEQVKPSSNDTNDTNNTNDALNIKSYLKLNPHYGFLNMHHSIFTDYARAGLAHDMLELPTPDETPADDRRKMRLEVEDGKFSKDRYLSDLYLSSSEEEDGEDDGGDMVYSEAIHMVPHWVSHVVAPETQSTSVDHITAAMETLTTTTTPIITTPASDNNNITTDTNTHTTIPQSQSNQQPEDPQQQQLTTNESFRLTSIKPSLPIPHPTTINPHQTQTTLLHVLDLLYAYVYDHRTTSGDPTVESSWTIVNLSPTLSWLEVYTPPYDSVLDVMRGCVRRGLIYPYLRNWDFVAEVLVGDVVGILGGGRRMVIRCLLAIRDILEKSESHYLFCKIWIDPLLSWVQVIDEEVMEVFALEVKGFFGSSQGKDGGGMVMGVMDKGSMGLGLVEIEGSVCSASDEEEDSSSSGSDSPYEDDDDDDEENSSSSASSSETTNDDSLPPLPLPSLPLNVSEKVVESEEDSCAPLTTATLRMPGTIDQQQLLDNKPLLISIVDNNENNV